MSYQQEEASMVMPLIIEGWYEAPKEPKKSPASTKVDVAISKVLLQPSLVYTAKRHEVYDLSITDIKKIQGSFFNPTYVRGIADLRHDTLFFVDERKVPKLRSILSRNPSGEVL